MLQAIVHAADIQDRDGGAMVMATLFGLYPFLLKLYADAGYQGPVFQTAVKKIMAQVDVEIVRRSDQAKGFVVLPKRCVAHSGDRERSIRSIVNTNPGDHEHLLAPA